MPGDAFDSQIAHPGCVVDCEERRLPRVGGRQPVNLVGFDAHVQLAGLGVDRDALHVGGAGPVVRVGAVKVDSVEVAVVSHAPEEVAVLREAKSGKFDDEVLFALLELPCRVPAHDRQVAGGGRNRRRHLLRVHEQGGEDGRG